MANDLTDLAIRKASAAASRREIPDGKLRGLFLIVQPSGKKSWAVRYRLPDGRSRKHTIGGFPAIDLGAARRLGAKALSAVAEGIDPAAEKRRQREAIRTPASHEIVEKAVDHFIERHAKAKTRASSWKEAQRILKAEVVKRWRGKRLGVITRSDIHALLDDIVDRGAPIAANRSLAVMSRFFNWAVEREIIPVSPCAGIKPPSAPRQRDRVLTDEELRLVWSAAGEVGWPFGSIVRLLILTGQRRDEVAGMRWPELDLEEAIWTLPRGRVKNDRGHSVPLSTQALEVVNQLPRLENKSKLVFSTTGETPVSGFARAKRRIDALVLEKIRSSSTDAKDGSFLNWTLHDLRRTFASGAARFGVAPQVVEAILNHRSGTIRGVAAIYNRYDYAKEKRSALDLWGRHIESLTTARGCIVQMRTAS